MENQHDNSDVDLSKKATAELLEKSAQLKIKNARIMEKLNQLKKGTENLLKGKPNEAARD